jgi:hypothetical protein
MSVTPPPPPPGSFPPPPPSGWLQQRPDDPLVPGGGFGAWWSKLFATAGRSWRRLVPLLLVVGLAGALLVLPVDIWTAHHPLLDADGHWIGGGGRLPRLAAYSALSAAVTAVFTVIASMGGIWLIVHDAAGRATSYGDTVRFGLRRFWAMVGWTIVAAVLTIGGFLLLVLPGIWVGVVLAGLLTGVLAFERVTPIGRAFILARGGWWGLLGRLVLIGFLGAVYSGIVAGIVYAAIGLHATTDGELFGRALIGTVVGLPVKVVAAAFAVVTYAQRRAAHEPCTTTTLLADLQR